MNEKGIQSLKEIFGPMAIVDELTKVDKSKGTPVSDKAVSGTPAGDKIKINMDDFPIDLFPDKSLQKLSGLAKILSYQPEAYNDINLLLTALYSLEFTLDDLRSLKEYADRTGLYLKVEHSPEVISTEYLKYWKKQKELEAKEKEEQRIKNLILDSQNLNLDYKEGRLNEQKYIQLLEELSLRASVGAPGNTLPTPMTEEEYIEPKNKNSLLTIFTGHEIEPGTINYIGGRPGNGKTTLMISIMVDALINTDLDCRFFTYEESYYKITTKILLCLYGALSPGALETDYNICPEKSRPWNRKHKTPLRELLHLKYKGALQEFGAPEWIKFSYDKLFDWINSGRLKIYDTPGNADVLINILKQQTNTIDFIDYAQKIQPGPDTPMSTRQIQLQSISAAILEAEKKADNIGFIGTQLNNDIPESEKKIIKGWKPGDQPESQGLSLGMSRESKDLEQDATCVIGINSTPSVNFYKRVCIHTMKNREGDIITVDGFHHVLFWHIGLYPEPKDNIMEAKDNIMEAKDNTMEAKDNTNGKELLDLL